MFWRWWIMNKAAQEESQCSLGNTVFLRVCHMLVLQMWQLIMRMSSFNIFWTAFIGHGCRIYRPRMPSKKR